MPRNEAGRYRHIEVHPVAGALGAEIRGVNLARSLDDTTFAAIERAYNQYGVIFFRGQDIAPPQQVAFTRRFGEIEFNIFGERWSVPGSPEIVVVSNVTEDGQPIGVRRAGENWHSDMCYAPRPPRGTMLYALEIPDLFGLSLGDTEFASAAAAWDALPEPLRRRIEGRRAVFDFAGRISAAAHVRWTETQFVEVIVLLGPAIWIAGALGVYKRHPLGNFVAWFLFVGMMVGEPAHFLVFPFLEGGRYHYFPGMWTARCHRRTGAGIGSVVDPVRYSPSRPG